MMGGVCIHCGKILKYVSEDICEECLQLREQESDMTLISVSFNLALNALRNDKMRIACKYGPITTFYKPDTGQPYKFSEDWIADGEWFIVE